jgi:hypothetical protein
MTSVWKLPARFAPERTVTGMVHVVLRHQFVLIMEMRILELLMPLRARLNGMFRVFAHGIMGRAGCARAIARFLLYRKLGPVKSFAR